MNQLAPIADGPDILIAEDSATQAEGLRHLLDRNGYRVSVVENGRMAMAFLNDHQPALILSDINMPELDGYELCRMIKADERLQAIPVILLTSLSNAEDVLEGLACGAESFISKPYSNEYLLARIERTLADATGPLSEHPSSVVEIPIPGQRRVITADLRRMASLLISTYEAAINRNSELVQSQTDLRTINEHLEDLVAERTAGLTAEIAARQQAEAHSRYLATVLENVSDGVVSTNLHGEIVSWNAGAEAMFGYAAGEVVGRPYAEVLAYDYLDSSEEASRAQVRATGQWSGEVRVRRKNGTRIVVLVGSAVLNNSEGSMLGFSVVLHDITERREAQERIRYLAGVLENVSNAVVSLDLQGNLLSWNIGAETLFGHRSADVIGRSYSELVAFDYLDTTEAEAFQKVIETGRWIGEVRAHHLDGRELFILVACAVLQDGTDTAIGFTGVLHDITERKQAEKALAQTTDLLSRAEQIGHLGSWEWVIASNRVTWSDGLYRIFGVDPETFEPTFAAYMALIHPDDREWMRLAVEESDQTHGPLELECRIVRPDGQVRILYRRSETILDGQGRPVRQVGMEMDITELKRREQELEAIAAVSIALRTANTQVQMLPIILEQVAALLHTEAAALALRDLATDELVVVLGHGQLTDLVGQRLPVDAGIGGSVLSTSQEYVTANALTDPPFYPINVLSPPSALACVPLVTNQQALGVLWAGRVSAFTEAEVRVLGAISSLAASAIQRAGLHEQTERQLQRLTALREIDGAIMNSLDLQTTLTILLSHVTRQLDVDASDVLLFSRGLQLFEYAAGRGFRSAAVEQTRLRLGEGHAGQAGLERRLVAAPDLRADPRPFRRAALLAGEEFAALVSVPLIAKGQVVGVLEVFHRTPLIPNADWIGFLEALAGQAAIAVADAWLFADLQRSNVDMLVAYDTTLDGWSAALDLRDKETEGHSQRVCEHTLRLAMALGVNETELVHIRRGALLHDIGKMGVPDAILLKPGKLTDDEWVSMRQHPRLAYDLLAPIAFLRPALDIPYCHHEKWDGTGYPRQLKGEGIPLAARIFAVVDVWDALRSDRPYRLGWPDDKVMAYIVEQSGQHFDPKVVRAFCELTQADFEPNSRATR